MDRMLDSLLQQYGHVEPGPGLESRILARIRTEAVRSSSSRRWAWILAEGVAAILLLLMVAGIRHRPVPVLEDSTMARAPERNDIAQASRSIPANASSASRRATARSRRAGRVREPRLDQFPSPRPLTRRELALVDYVARFPQEALLVAKQQAEFEEDIRTAEQEFESPSSEKER
jgi:hypothetical protein